MAIQQQQPLEVLIEEGTVKLSGAVSVQNIASLAKEVRPLYSQIKAVDCQQLKAADSSFLALLLWLQAHKQQAGSGGLVIRHASESLQTLRQLYDLDKVLIFEG